MAKPLVDPLEWEWRVFDDRSPIQTMPLRLPKSLIALAFLLLVAWPAAGELVILQDGRVIKAASYKVLHEDEEVEVFLKGGGSFRLELARIERILDDEVIVSDVVVAEAVGPQPQIAYDLSYQEGRKPLFGTPYDKLIEGEAKRSNVDASLVSALIRAESNYAARAVSHKGARGLMQLMPATARRLDVRRPFDPASNVRGGVKYLRELLDRFDNKPELVLAAYNAGEHAVERFGGVPPYRETVSYVKRILSWWTPAVAAAVAPAVNVPAKTGASPSGSRH